MYRTGIKANFYNFVWNVISKNTESPCCIPETSTIVQVIYT